MVYEIKDGSGKFYRVIIPDLKKPECFETYDGTYGFWGEPTTITRDDFFKNIPERTHEGLEKYLGENRHPGNLRLGILSSLVHFKMGDSERFLDLEDYQNLKSCFRRDSTTPSNIYSLRAQMSILRKTIGDRKFITNSTRRGYSLESVDADSNEK